MNHLTEIKLAIMSIIGIGGSFLASFLGGWDTALQTLVIFMAIDYITGVIVAAVFKKSKKTSGGGLDSTIGFKGLFRKGTTLLIVLIAYRIDMTLGSNFIRTAVVIAYIVNESISITENAGLMGIPIPKIIRKGINALAEGVEYEK